MTGKLSTGRSPAGFTLLEMLVVVVIIAVLFGIAAPGWIAFLNARRVNNSRDQVAILLRQAQSEAIRTRRAYGVRFNDSSDPNVPLPNVAIGPYVEEDIPAQTIEALGYGSYPENTIELEVKGVDSTDDLIVFASNGTVDLDETYKEPPIEIILEAEATGAKRCLVLETLLGGIRLANPGERGCDE